MVLLKCLCQLPGIGLLGAAWLIFVTNGFTTCESAEQLASYLGLVPHRCDSGNRTGHKPIGTSGHARARRDLFQEAHALLGITRDPRPLSGSAPTRKPLSRSLAAIPVNIVHQAFAVARAYQEQLSPSLAA